MFAFGENKMGQLGLGNQTDAVPSPAQVHASSPSCADGLGWECGFVLIPGTESSLKQV